LNFTEIAKIRGKIGNFIAGQGSFVVKMFTTDSSVRMFELILMSGRNSRTPICDKKNEEAVESRAISSGT
jgi:hypothetical protein